MACRAEEPCRAQRETIAQSSLRKAPFVDEILVLVLAPLITIFFVISMGRLDFRISQNLLANTVFRPSNVIILVINFLGKLYFAYGSVRFWSSVLPRRSPRTLATSGHHQESVSIPVHATSEGGEKDAC